MSSLQWIYDFDLFLFDFDGLLVDTEALHYEAYREMMQKRGFALEWSFPYYCGLAHVSATAIREALYAQFPNLDRNWEALYAEKKACYLELLASGSVLLMPGVQKLLDALHEADIRRCTVTHSPLVQIQQIRARLPVLDSIPHWITREDYNRPKPDSECYLKAISLYGKKGDKIIGFEDTPRGLKALQGTSALPVWICASPDPCLQAKIEGPVLHYSSFERVCFG